MNKFMKTACVAAGMLFALGGLSACGEEQTPPEDQFREIATVSDLGDYERVNLYGRTMYSESMGGELIACSAAGFEVRIRGTGLKASAKATLREGAACQFSVFIDGEKDSNARVVTVPSNSFGYSAVTLAEGLPEGEHTIKVLKRTDSLYNTAYFEKLTAEGVFLRAPERTKRTIEVFGDSITCGYGVLRKYTNENGEIYDSKDYSGETQNVFQSYAGVAAADLDMDLRVYGRSGIPLYFKRPNETYAILRNPAAIAVDLDPAVYPYDYNSFRPDAVVVYLGTNDYIRRNDSGFTADGMKAETTRFLRDVIGTYYGKDIPIALCSGMMMKRLTGLDDVMRDVQRSLASEFPNLIHVEFEDTIMGDGAHPVLEESAVAGHLLAEKLGALL